MNPNTPWSCRLIQGFLGYVAVASLSMASWAQVATPDEWLARELVPPELPVSTQNQLSLHGPVSYTHLTLPTKRIV